LRCETPWRRGRGRATFFFPILRRSRAPGCEYAELERLHATDRELQKELLERIDQYHAGQEWPHQDVADLALEVGKLRADLDRLTESLDTAFAHQRAEWQTAAEAFERHRRMSWRMWYATGGRRVSCRGAHWSVLRAGAVAADWDGPALGRARSMSTALDELRRRLGVRIGARLEPERHYRVIWGAGRKRSTRWPTKTRNAEVDGGACKVSVEPAGHAHHATRAYMNRDGEGEERGRNIHNGQIHTWGDDDARTFISVAPQRTHQLHEVAQDMIRALEERYGIELDDDDWHAVGHVHQPRETEPVDVHDRAGRPRANHLHLAISHGLMPPRRTGSRGPEPY
jgi:hypothetical protein